MVGEAGYKDYYRLAELAAMLKGSPERHWHEAITTALERYFTGQTNSDVATHLGAIAPWLGLEVGSSCLEGDVISVQAAADSEVEADALKASLMAIGPWRKGPFSLFGVAVDAEWRADMKWERIQPCLLDGGVRGTRILDVGAGNGYYTLRLLGAGANSVLGIDPGVHAQAQFLALASWLRPQAWLVPARLEDMPVVGEFDWVLSMGVLSHQRSPEEHLRLLHSKLAPGSGRLLLETLVVPEAAGETLVPTERYAGMRNVWQLPSVPCALDWLKATGFKRPEWIRTDATTTSEQRATEWMRFESLANWLDPNDPSLTIEGYPAPLRAIFIAES